MRNEISHGPRKAHFGRVLGHPRGSHRVHFERLAAGLLIFSMMTWGYGRENTISGSD
jgi:hypothetical protein